MPDTMKLLQKKKITQLDTYIYLFITYIWAGKDVIIRRNPNRAKQKRKDWKIFKPNLAFFLS